MEITKTKRTVDPSYIKKIQAIACVGCGKHGPSEAHHIKSRGSGGGDDFWNLIPLCHSCHTSASDSWHKIGAISFLMSRPHVMELISNWGWIIIRGQLLRENKNGGSIIVCDI